MCDRSRCWGGGVGGGGGGGGGLRAQRWQKRTIGTTTTCVNTSGKIFAERVAEGADFLLQKMGGGPEKIKTGGLHSGYRFKLIKLESVVFKWEDRRY